MKRALLLISLFGLLAGCDKLKGALGKGDEAGAPPIGDPGLVGTLFGADFEGDITLKMTSKVKPADTQTMVAGIKKPRFRFDMNTAAAGAEASAILFDPPAKKAWMLIPSKKMAMVIDLEKAKAGMATIPGMKPVAKPTTPPKIEKTGKKDVVAGYTCEIWNITQDGKRSELCVAEGITWIDLASVGGGSPEVAIAAVATDANRFPLRVITFDTKNAEEFRMEAQKVEKKKLDDARFVPPPDFQIVDLANLGKLQGGFPFAPK